MGDSEQDHTFEIAKACAELLKSYECNVCLIPKIKGTESETLDYVVNYSNQFVRNNPSEINLHIDIHTDGGYNATGSSAFYISEGGKKLATSLHSEISQLTPWGDGRVTQRRLFVITNTLATAALIEVSFHDDKEESQWIHINIENIAKAIVRGLEQNGVKKRESSVQAKEHWAEIHYQGCLKKGYKIDEKRFDDGVTRGELFALLSQNIR
jgi:N-acetylmuramoyl-L-alanine amidase